MKPGEVWSYDTDGAWLVGRILDKASEQALFVSAVSRALHRSATAHGSN